MKKWSLKHDFTTDDGRTNTGRILQYLAILFSFILLVYLVLTMWGVIPYVEQPTDYLFKLVVFFAGLYRGKTIVKDWRNNDNNQYNSQYKEDIPNGKNRTIERG